MFKSTDAGASWRRSDSNLSHRVVALAIDPQTPATLYAGGDGVRPESLGLQLAPPSVLLTTEIKAGETPTYAIFAQANGAIPL